MTTELTKAAQQALKPHQIAQLVNKLRDIAREFHAHDCLRELISREINDAHNDLSKSILPNVQSALTQRPAAQEEWPGQANITSPFNACQHKSYCTQLAPLPAPQQATPSRFGSPDLQALIVQHATQQATHEPVGEPWGWAIEDKHGVAQAIRPARKEFFGCVQSSEPFTAEDVSKMDREWAGLAPHRIVTLYTRPAPGVPEGLPAVLTDWGFDVHDDEDGRTWLTIRNPDDDVARMSVPTVWPLNGNQTIGAVVLHQFSAALSAALAAAQAKGGAA